ncbi:hypothetical protein SCP_0205690 [Sparassis crispa]|uniref:Uncharacterized protein n=1 Tax=Sparassis crispa TaxID=139825 RepID=A0A401GB47_9APHY|nr:hypothetical protein SCP_0205690 [Sparassis crispa]GBE79371.1 hypothetical protein SCP_0205690 [Sparassis crispa]
MSSTQEKLTRLTGLEQYGKASSAKVEPKMTCYCLSGWYMRSEQLIPAGTSMFGRARGDLHKQARVLRRRTSKHTDDAYHLIFNADSDDINAPFEITPRVLKIQFPPLPSQD